MTQDDPGTAEPMNLGLLLFIQYRSMECAVLAHLKAHGHDLPLSQARVFERIAPGGSRVGELARAAQVSKQTVGSVVDQLERAGYVTRVPDPADARARLVLLTDLGRELVELSLPVVREIEDTWRAHLGAARTRELRSSLEALRQITDPFADQETTAARRDEEERATRAGRARPAGASGGGASGRRRGGRGSRGR